MKQPTILKKYRSAADDALLAVARTIIAAMTGNANFPTPTPTLAAVTEITDGYEEALSAARYGNRVQKTEKRNQKKVLVDILDLLGLYVLMAAEGSLAVLQSSGFPMTQQGGPAIITKPTNLKLSLGDLPGQLWLKFGRVEYMRIYIYQYALGELTESTQWTTAAMGTTCKYLFTGLPSRQQVYVRVVVIGTDSQEIASDAVSMVVQ